MSRTAAGWPSAWSSSRHEFHWSQWISPGLDESNRPVSKKPGGTRRETDHSSSPQYVRVNPMNDDKKKGVCSSWTAMLFYAIEGNRKRFFLALAFGLVSNAFITITNPLALKYLFDEGIIRRNFRFFVILSLSFVLIFTLWRGCTYLYRLYAQRLKNSVFEGLCVKMLNKYYQIPYDEIIKREGGYFLSRIYDEVITAAPLLIDCSFSVLNTIITLVVAIAVSATISWRATLAILIAIPLGYGLSRKYARRIKTQSKLEKEEEAKLRGVLVRAIGSYKITRVFNLEDRILSRTIDQLHRFLDAFFLRFRTGSLYQTLSGMFMSYAETIAIIGAGYEMLSGRMSFGGFMGFMSAFWMVMGSAREIFNLVPELSRVIGLVERIKEFGEVDTRQVNIKYSRALKLERVSFAYNGKNVVEDFNLEPGPGEKILIVGPNGSGKSTLAHLMAGLLQPSSGETTTFPINRTSAVIFPSDFIPGSVKDNVSFAISESSKNERFERLAHDFGLGDHLEKDPSELSGGQRKKLEIIMSLVKDADMYILDEPLAGIDVESKSRVITEIFRYAEGKTLIVVMHGDAEFYGSFDRVIDLGADADCVRRMSA
jgi:ABC-type multidrug transport system fused ATPase/permease subunit